MELEDMAQACEGMSDYAEETRKRLIAAALELRRPTREQTLVNMCFQLAMVSKEYMQDKNNQEIAEWVAKQLHDMGFPTHPVGMSWGILDRST